MVGRRDSVVGARIDDRAPLSAGLSWVWVAAGCAAVLAPGMLGVWLLSRASSASASVTPSETPAAKVVAAVVAAPEAARDVEIEPLVNLRAMVPDNDAPRPAAAPGRPSGPAPHVYRHRWSAARRAAYAAAMAANATESSPSAAPAAAAAPAPAAPPAPAPTSAAAEARADDTQKAEKTEKPDESEKPKKVVEAAPEEPIVGPPKTVKELRSALARLQPRVFQCHQRFQIDGVADVKVAVNPSGTVESASLAGEFEGTPTGDCIVRLVSAASFPSFDGFESIRVSHSFPLQ